MRSAFVSSYVQPGVWLHAILRRLPRRWTRERQNALSTRVVEEVEEEEHEEDEEGGLEWRKERHH